MGNVLDKCCILLYPDIDFTRRDEDVKCVEQRILAMEARVWPWANPFPLSTEMKYGERVTHLESRLDALQASWIQQKVDRERHVST